MKKHRRKTKLEKSIEYIITAALIICMVFITANMIIVFDEHSTTFKYQLHNDLKRNDPLAVEHYKQNYLAKGKVLYSDIHITE